MHSDDDEKTVLVTGLPTKVDGVKAVADATMVASVAIVNLILPKSIFV